MVLVKDDFENMDKMDLPRKKTKDSNNHHLRKASGNESKQSERGQHFIDHLYSLDITLSRKLSFCADKASGRWRTLMIILEITGHGVPWIAGTLISVIVFSCLKQEFACNLFLALMFDLAVVGTLKVTVRRKRPIYNEKDMFATVSVDNYSFPSGHSTRAAMVAGLFAVFLTSEFWRFLIGCWALCVSASRVILGRHHVSDVLCGFLIGILQCWVVCTMWVPNTTCQELLAIVPFYDDLRKQVAIPYM